MNREDLIRMAQKAGAIPIHKDYSQKALVGNENIERFAALVAAAEREACAKVCDFEVSRLTAIEEPRPALAVGICAAAIRARGETLSRGQA